MKKQKNIKSTMILNLEVHYSDGIHNSLQGNRFVAEKLFDLIEKDLKYVE